MKLSDLAIRNLVPKEKMYRVSDGGSLYLEIYPNGKKLWRIRLKKQGKETMLSLGAYPTIGLKDARIERDKINVLRSSGTDPAAERRKQKLKETSRATTFEIVYEEWREKHRPPVWSEVHYEKVTSRARKYLLPKIGSLPIADIDPPLILAVVRAVEKKQLHETAHKALVSNCKSLTINICSLEPKADI